MKIVYVLTRSDVMGGASVHLLDLAAGMQELGHDVHILVGGNGVFNKKASERSLSCSSLKSMRREISPWSDIKAFFELVATVRKIQPDILHLHSSKAGLVGRLVGVYLSIPTVFTAHGWAFTDGVSPLRRKVYLGIERFMARCSNKIITVSNYDRDLALREGVGNSQIIITIHNGIPHISGFSVRNSNECVRIIMVARFEAPKDQNTLIEALGHLKDYSWTMEFIGDGPSLEASKQLARKLGISNRISFFGECFDVPERLAEADIFVLISSWEGLPLTILEAMRAALPVIASNVGGVSELVDHDNSGILINRGDKTAVRDALKVLLSSPQARQEMGSNGRRRFEHDFCFEEMLEKTLAVYTALLQK